MNCSKIWLNYHYMNYSYTLDICNCFKWVYSVWISYILHSSSTCTNFPYQLDRNREKTNPSFCCSPSIWKIGYKAFPYHLLNVFSPYQWNQHYMKQVISSSKHLMALVFQKEALSNSNNTKYKNSKRNIWSFWSDSCCKLEDVQNM